MTERTAPDGRPPRIPRRPLKGGRLRGPTTSNDGKRSIAVRMALGTALDEVADVVRQHEDFFVFAGDFPQWCGFQGFLKP